MTRKEFYERLGKNRKHWEDIGGSLRAYSKHTQLEYCPITAVAYDMLHRYCHTADFRCAAQDIGLRKRDAEAIAKASDGIRCGRTYNKLKKILKVNG
jgi:hypothetical protein